MEYIKKTYFVHNYITIINFRLRLSFRNKGKVGSHKSGVYWLDPKSERCMPVVCSSTNFGGHPMTMFHTIAKKGHDELTTNSTGKTDSVTEVQKLSSWIDSSEIIHLSGFILYIF
jgi:hypothetical protein